MTPKEVLNLIKEKDIKFVDFKFQDFIGTWQHFSVPSQCLEEDSFEDGYGFDGSSIRGWKAINESDMLMLPDPTTAFVDPFLKVPTLSLQCSILDPITKEPYTRDPRNVAKKCEEYIKSTGIGDTAFIGPEAEFFIFDSIRFGQEANFGMYEIDSEEAIWNSAAEIDGGNLGHRPRHKEGYFPCPPVDTQQDIRSEMVLTLQELGIEIEAQHHEVATAGQAEIDMKFGSLVRMADQVMMYKYVIKNVARRYGKTVTFMPKPLFGDNGSGMHVHVSIWKDGQPTFAGDKYAGLSETGLYFMGGILKHAAAVIALTNPTTNFTTQPQCILPYPNVLP